MDDVDYSVYFKRAAVFLDLYIKQHRGLHALCIGPSEHSACSVPSPTQFSLLGAETFDKDCYSGSSPSRGK